jgi:hypothetical protein
VRLAGTVVGMLFLCMAAGCSQPAPDGSADQSSPAAHGRVGRNDEAEASDDNLTLRGFHSEFGLRLTSANAGLVLPNLQGTSCVQVRRAPFNIVSGTATLEWTPQSALAESLSLDVLDHYSGTIHASGSGPSPLTVSLDEVKVEATRPEGELLDFRVTPDGMVDGAIDQDAIMTLDLHYYADSELLASTLASC